MIDNIHHDYYEKHETFQKRKKWINSCFIDENIYNDYNPNRYRLILLYDHKSIVVNSIFVSRDRECVRKKKKND